MAVQFAKSFIDGLYESKDLFALCWVIEVVADQKELPEEFWLFSELWRWCCSNHSGIWQYYQGLQPEKFERIVLAAEKFELGELANQYRSGKNTWPMPNGCAALEEWIEDHWPELEDSIYGLVKKHREWLYSSERVHPPDGESDWQKP